MRKSRFIGVVSETGTREQQQQFVAQLAIQYPDASHVCYATRLGSVNNPQEYCDDDGEPSGTAGKPILNVLCHSVAGNTTLAVVRYFGGVKLGAGGLVRAYTAAASTVMQKTIFVQQVRMISVAIDCEYAFEDTLRNRLELLGATSIDAQYGQQLKLNVELPADNLDKLRQQLNDLTRGQGQLCIPR